jgi:hypothetical protein
MSLSEISSMCGISVRRCALAFLFFLAALCTSLHAHAHMGTTDRELGVESSQCVVCACLQNPFDGSVSTVAVDSLEAVDVISLRIGVCVRVLPTVASSLSFARAPPATTTSSLV